MYSFVGGLYSQLGANESRTTDEVSLCFSIIIEMSLISSVNDRSARRDRLNYIAVFCAPYFKGYESDEFMWKKTASRAQEWNKVYTLQSFGELGS